MFVIAKEFRWSGQTMFLHSTETAAHFVTNENEATAFKTERDAQDVIDTYAKTSWLQDAVILSL